MNTGSGARGSWVRWLLAAVLLAACLGVPGAARADDPVNSFYGSFGTQIPIEVPKFHGLEPALKLGYSSSLGNGFAGVGWSLGGFSSIERASPGTGAPAYSSTDVFLVDGEPLVPDTSMGCQYSTRIKNYSCISFNSASNTWTALGTNGNRATYSPVYATARGTFRWGLTAVTDTHANVVSYAWSCDNAASGYANDCYPASVSYDGTVVTLYRAARPDPITFANGSSVGQSNYRLNSVDVQVSGARARTYQLTYSTSASTSRSVLASVQQFGDDATLNSAGTVTGGTSLPPMTMGQAMSLGTTYEGPSSAGVTNPSFSAPTNWQSYVGINSWSEFWLGDFNGDGKKDVMWLSPSPVQYMVMLSTGSGFAAPVSWAPYGTGCNSTSEMWVADFNGDGKSDFMCISPSPYEYTVWLSTGSSFTASNWAPYGTGCNSSSQMWVADFNGDGKSDFMCLNAGATEYVVMVSTGTGFAGYAGWAPYVGIDSWTCFWLGDFNGDGKKDIMYLSTASPDYEYTVLLSTGSSFAAPVIWATYEDVNAWSQFWVSDFNGDGKTDIMYLSTPSPSYEYTVMLSTGSAFEQPAVWAPYVGIDSFSYFWLGDFNGDRRTDFMYLSTAPYEYTVMTSQAPVALSSETQAQDISLEQSFSQPTTWQPYVGINAWSQFWQGDFNGDGKTDVMYLSTSPYEYMVMLSTGSSFAAPVSWAPYVGIDTWSAFWLGDYNGDGKTDIMYLSTSPYEYMVMLSTGSGFAAPAAWASYGAGVNAWSEVWVSDFNGDGMTDLMYLNPGATEYTVMLSTGSALAAPTNWAPYVGIDSWSAFWLNDFNGDGKVDVMYLSTSPYEYMVMLSTGAGFAAPASWAPYGAGVNAWSEVWVSDFNGDGKADLMYLNPGATEYTVMLSTGGSLAAPVSWAPYVGIDSWSAFWLNDFNGDGMTDIMYLSTAPNEYMVMASTGTGFAAPVVWAPYDNINAWSQFWIGDYNGDGKKDIMYLSTASPYNDYTVMLSNSPGDEVASIQNGLGGTTTVTYAPSSAWANTYLPQGLVFQTVSALTTSDGRGTSSTASYQYQGGLWSSSERRFLGFRYVKSVIDAAGDYNETYYHQDVGCISKPDSTYYRSATGSIYSYSTMTYTENSAAPYTSLLTTRWDYQCDLTSSCRRTLLQFGYDQYANLDLEYNYGDYDVSGDETTLVRGYYPNTSTYVVSVPAYENKYLGIGTSGALRRQTLYEYDGATSYTTAPTLGSRTATLEWNDKTGAYLTTTFAYDSYGNRTSWTPPRGATQTTTFDATYHMYPTQECNSLGQCATSTWNAVLGELLSKTDANGGVTSHAYDALGRPISETLADGHTTTFSYVNWGSPTTQYLQKTVSDGSSTGIWEQSYYDGLQRPWQHVRKDGTVESILYDDASSRVWQKSYWYNPGAGETPRYIVNAYDGVGRLVSQTMPDGHSASSIYSAGPGYTTVTHQDELGHQRAVTTDAYGHTVQVVEVNGSTNNTTSYTVDPFGVVTAVTDPNGNVSSFTFNSLNWKLAECLPDIGCLTYQYDGSGDLVGRTDARGNELSFSYDSVGRKIEEAYPNGTTLSWSYDQAGHGASLDMLTSLTDLNGTASYTYDTRGRVTSSTRCVRGTCYTATRSYTLSGSVASDTYPDGEVVHYGYDVRGRLVSVQGNSTYVSTISYDSNDHVVSETYGNGVTSAYGYDANRQWLTSANVASKGTTLYNAGYTYDAAGRVTAMTSSTDATLNLSYAYDALNRLTGVSGGQSQSWTYDAIGNITSSSALGTYTYGNASQPHAVTAAGSGSYTYDASGNMLTAPQGSYAWSYDNQLLSATTSGGTSTYGYDAAGQRVYQADAAGNTHYYFGSLFELSNGALVKHYFAGVQRVAMSTAAGTTWWHTDHLGSVRAATNASGQLAGTHSYTPFGTTLATTGTADTSIGFDGQRADATGLVYMNARYYQPTLGRFLSADSMVPGTDNSLALNRYAFAFDNPVSNVDPTGHAPIVAVVMAVVEMAAGAEGIIAGAEGFALAVDAAEVIGGAMSIAGFATNNPWLSTIGGVLLGFAGGSNTWGYVAGAADGTSLAGGLVGAGFAAASSPLSPLDPGLKQEIGWAYLGVSLGATMYTEIANTVADPSQTMTAYSGKYGNATQIDTGNGDVVYSQTPNGNLQVTLISQNADANQQILDELHAAYPNASIQIDSRLLSPDTNVQADMGAGPGTCGACEEGGFFNSMDRAIPFSSNLTGFVHEVLYSAISRILGGWESSMTPALPFLSVTDEALMYITEPLIAIPTLLVTAPMDLVSQGLGVGPYAPGSGMPAPIW